MKADKKGLSSNNNRKNSFRSTYVKYCEEHNIRPIMECLSKQETQLFMNADKVKLNDWETLFEVLKMFSTLKDIRIYSNQSKKDWPHCVASKANSAYSAAAIQGPKIYSSYILKKLIDTLGSLLTKPDNPCLELQLELPLATKFCASLSNVLKQSNGLRYVSLAGSCIGDAGCEQLCQALKVAPNIRILNLSKCKLGVRAIESLTKVIEYHNLLCLEKTWENSLRYRTSRIINLGIVRLTLNENPGVGNIGAKKIADVLRNNQFTKAVDLQDCNITEPGAVDLLSMLDCNQTVAIIDVRANKGVSKNLKELIANKLRSNSGRSSNEFQIQWLPISKPQCIKSVSRNYAD